MQDGSGNHICEIVGGGLEYISYQDELSGALMAYVGSIHFGLRLFKEQWKLIRSFRDDPQGIGKRLE